MNGFVLGTNETVERFGGPYLAYLPDLDQWVNLGYVIRHDHRHQLLSLDHRSYVDVIELSMADSDLLHAELTKLTNPPMFHTYAQTDGRSTEVTVEAVDRATGFDLDAIDRILRGEEE